MYKIRKSLPTYILVFAVIFFEMYSFSSARNGIILLTGMTLWATWLAFAFVAVDFGGIGMLILEKKEINKSLFGSWILSAIFDTWLSYLNISTEAAQNVNNIMVLSGTVSLETFTKTIPIIVAVASWAVQVLLISSFNEMISRKVSHVPSKTKAQDW